MSAILVILCGGRARVLLQHFQRALPARAAPRHATSCNAQLLHEAASGARRRRIAAVAEIWNAPARSVRFAASFCCRSMHLHADCARAARERDGLGCVAWIHGGTLLCARVKYSRSDLGSDVYKALADRREHELLNEVIVGLLASCRLRRAFYAAPLAAPAVVLIGILLCTTAAAPSDGARLSASSPPQRRRVAGVLSPPRAPACCVDARKNSRVRRVLVRAAARTGRSARSGSAACRPWRATRRRPPS